MVCTGLYMDKIDAREYVREAELLNIQEKKSSMDRNNTKEDGGKWRTRL